MDRISACALKNKPASIVDRKKLISVSLYPVLSRSLDALDPFSIIQLFRLATPSIVRGKHS